MTEGYEITKEEASKIVVNFGKKHPGETLGQILETDKNYLLWLIGQENTKQSMKEAIAKLIDYPSEEEQKEILELLGRIQDLSIEKDIDLEEVKSKFKVNSLNEMSIEQMKKCVVAMEKKEV